MRPRTILWMMILSLALPASLGATPKTYNEAIVEKMDGTIMVQHIGDAKPFALQTGSTVEKGDIITVYDKSWVIFKTHWGDHIGLDSDTVASIDEYYIQGPDRQLRFILQKGTLFLKTNGSGSRQSFFEINSGSVVTAINDVRAILSYDSAKERLRVQYFYGKLTVVDKDNEQKFKIEHVEHNWENGKMAEEEPLPVDELDLVNFNRFFYGEPRLPPTNNNMILNELDRK